MEEQIKDFVMGILNSEYGKAIPGETIIGLARYLILGEWPGGFLQGVLENDLTKAILLGDAQNIKGLASIVKWLFSYAPDVAWGSKEKVHKWVNKKRGGEL